MGDISKHLAFIARCEDPKQLENLMANAREQGEATLEATAFKRLASLVPDVAPGSLEHDFWQVIQAFELVLKQERGKTVRLARTRQKVKRDGILKTLSDWALGPPTEGFEMLKARGMLDLSGEAIVVRHADLFPTEAVEAARKRLGGSGVGQ